MINDATRTSLRRLLTQKCKLDRQKTNMVCDFFDNVVKESSLQDEQYENWKRAFTLLDDATRLLVEIAGIETNSKIQKD